MPAISCCNSHESGNKRVRKPLIRIIKKQSLYAGHSQLQMRPEGVRHKTRVPASSIGLKLDHVLVPLGRSQLALDENVMRHGPGVSGFWGEGLQRWVMACGHEVAGVAPVARSEAAQSANE
jgi:hypothetical protein